MSDMPGSAIPVGVDVNLFCADPVALMEFYRAILGLPENEAARSPIYRALRLGEAELGFNKTDAYALLDLADRVPGDNGIRAYATFVFSRSDEIEIAAARIGEFGGRVIKGPYRTYYGAWQIVAEDPEGNVFRLNHRG
jgi:predicted enzyme related to lactoylglutathione lyase